MRTYFEKPLVVDISVTNRCNEHCDYCSAESGPFASKKGELPVEKFDSLFEELDLLNVPRISLAGGEPFIRTDIFEILDVFDKYRFTKILNTNGILLMIK